MLDVKKYPKFVLLLGNDSLDVFNYFKVDELHGLTRKAAERYPETKEDAYIMGLTNYSPTVNKLPFLFLNLSRFDGSSADHTAVMHECMHLSLLLNDWDIYDIEEKIVSDAERMANQILLYIRNLRL